ncbi:MAG: aldo/keto reductase [Candidatus Microthrix sp.]|nr:aldo/keto reductase [Candidatus Microthrix sp.]
MSGDLLVEAVLAGRERGVQIECDQFKYSLIDRSCEATHLPVTRRYGIRPAFYGILDEGLLAGVETRPPAFGHGRPALGVEIHPWPEAARLSLQRRRHTVELLSWVAQDAGISLYTLAVAFACDQQHSMGLGPAVVLGVSRFDQLELAAEASRYSLDASLRQAIDKIVVPGTSVGIPDRSRMRKAALPTNAGSIARLGVGDPRHDNEATHGC